MFNKYSFYRKWKLSLKLAEKLDRILPVSWDVAPDDGSLAPSLLTTVLVFSKRKDWKIQRDILKPPKIWQILKCSAHEYLSFFFFFFKSEYRGVGRMDSDDSGSPHHQVEAPEANSI